MENDSNTCEPSIFDNAIPSPPRHVFKIGTLTYSMGGLVILFCWLLMGDFAWSLKERSVYTIIQLMFKNFGASDTLNSLFMGAMPCLIGLIIGPSIGYCSDRHRGRWGRRIPYLVITTPIAALSMVGLALSPDLGQLCHNLLGGHSPGVNNLVISFLAFFWVVFEVGTITANGIFIALINDVVPHQYLGRFFGLFRAFSLIAGIIFNMWLIGKAEEHFMWIFIGFSIIYGVGFLLMSVKVKEGEYPMPEPKGEHDSPFAGISTYFKECFAKPYYLWIFIASTIAGMAFVPVNLFNVFYAKSLDISMTDFGRFMAVTFVVSLALSWYLGTLADRFHPLRLAIATLFIYAITSLLSGIFIQGKVTYGIALITHCVISGIFYTGTASLAQRLYPQSRFAQFCSAGGIIGSLAGIVITPLIGKILDMSNHAYSWTYFMGAILSALGLLTMIIVYRQFLALGGHSHYQPPE